MSANTTNNYSHIQDEDVLRKLWQDTDDFGKKKEIRSHMYKLREQRLREFYNGNEISESRHTTTSGKVTRESSSHTDSLVDQSFQSIKSKEVRDSESPTRDIQYKIPDKMATKEWQVQSSNETSLDGKLNVHSSVAAVEGTQKIEGGKIDFKAKSEKMSSMYSDADENSSITRSQNSSSSHVVTSSTRQNEPSNLQGVTNVIRETKTLPDGSTVTTTRYGTTSGSTSQYANQCSSSTSSRQFNESRTVDGTEEVFTGTKTFDPIEKVFTTTTKKIITSPEVYDDAKDNRTVQTSSNRVSSTKSSNISIPNDLQGVTKITRETKTLPDGSVMTTTKYDTATGTTTRSEIIGNVKTSKDVTNKSSKRTEETVTRDGYVKEDVDHQIIKNNIDNKTINVSTIERNNKDNQFITVAKHNVDETDRYGADSNNVQSEDSVTVTKYTSREANNDKFVNTERHQEEVNSTKLQSYKEQKPRDTEHPSSKPTGQYDYTNRKISIEVSPTHEAFARSLRSVSPDRIPSRGSHRTSNSSIPEKMRHPSRVSPERHPKDRSTSPTKSDRFSSTDTYIYNKNTTSQETITVTRSRSPTKQPKNEIVTDLDEDLNVPKQKPTGTRPTSLELSRKPKKITDRSPSSPLTDVGSPKRSPVKEIRRSSSFKGTSPKSPTKNLPEDRPLKRTDTYEERCRQILGITEVTEKRKSSLERSNSKRNSLRRNISSQMIDTSPTKSPTKERAATSPTKERPATSPTKERAASTSPTKERPATSPTKERPATSPTKERPATSPTKSPVKERPTSPAKSKSPVKERAESPVKERSESPTKSKSPLKERPKSPSKSRSTVSALDHIEIITTKTTYDSKEQEDVEQGTVGITVSKQPSSPTKTSKTSPVKEQPSSTIRTETIQKEENKTITRPVDRNITIQSSESKTVVEENNIDIKETTDESTHFSVLKKGDQPLPESLHPAQPKTTSIIPKNTVDNYKINTKFISEEKFTDVHSSTEVLVDENETASQETTEKRTKYFGSRPVGKNTTEKVDKDVPVTKTDDANGPVSKSTTETIEFITNEKIHRVLEDDDDKRPVSDTPEDRKVTTTTKTTEINQNKIERNLKTTKHSEPQPGTRGTPKKDDRDKPGAEADDENGPVSKTTTETIEIITSEKIHRGADNEDKEPVTDLPKQTKPKPSDVKVTKTTEINKNKTTERNLKTTKHSEPQYSTKGTPKHHTAQPEPETDDENGPVSKSTTETVEIITTEKIHRGPDTEDIKPKLSDLKVTKTVKTSEINKNKTTERNLKTTKHSEQQPSTKGPQKHDTAYPGAETDDENGPASKITTETIEIITSEKIHRGADNEDKEPVADLPKQTKPKLSDVKVTKTTKTTEINKNKTTERNLKTTKHSEPQPSTKGTPKHNTAHPESETDDENAPASKTTRETIEIITSEKIHRGPDNEDKKPVADLPKNTKAKLSDVKVTKTTKTTEINKNKTTERNLKTTKHSEPQPSTKGTPKHDTAHPEPETDDENGPASKTTTETTEIIISEKKHRGPDNEDTKPKQFKKTNKIEQNIKQSKDTEETIIDEFVVTEDSDNPKVVLGKPIPKDTKSIKKTKEDDTVIATNEFEIINTKKPSKKEPGLTEYPSQIKKPTSNKIRTDKKPVHKEPIATEKYFEPISYEGKIPVEEPLMVKKHINQHCKEDEEEKSETTKLVTKKTLPATKQKVTTIKKVIEKPLQSPIQRKPVNGISEYTKPKPNQTRPISKPLVNGIHKPSTVKVTKTTDVTKRTNKVITSRENESPGPKPKSIKSSPVSKPKSSPINQLNKKHIVTTTITLKDNKQPQKKPTKNDLTQKQIKDTEEDETTKDTSRKTVGKKCITTKTVLINNTEEQQRQIIVELRRSTSSREPTPDRISAVPTDSAGYDSPRYPDEILEPEEQETRTKPKRLSDIPIVESETVSNFSRITEITDKVVTDVDKVEDTDESLFSVNKKINLFSDNADKVKQIKKKPSGPAPKVERPKLEVSAGLETDECLLSVSEKVTKFVNAADQFMNVQDILERPKSPRCKFYDEKHTTEAFITAEKQVDTSKISLKHIDDKIKTPIEQQYPNYNTITKKVSLENLEIKSSPKNVAEQPPISKQGTTKTTVTTDFEETRRKPYDGGSPDRESPNRKSVTPTRRPSNEYGSIKTRRTSDELSTNREASPVEPSTPKSSKTKVEEDKKTFLSSTNRLRSTESIKKARAIFENISKDNEPSIRNKTVSKKLYTEEIKKTDHTPHYMLPLDRKVDQSEDISTTVKETDTTRSRSRSPENGDVPHYMLPLDRNVHTHSPVTTTTTNTSDCRSRSKSPEAPAKSGDVPHYMQPLDHTVHSHTHLTNTTTRESRSKIRHIGKDSPRNRSPEIPSETGDVPHYRLPLDRSVHDHTGRPRTKSPEREHPRGRSPNGGSETGDVPHYRLPLDRSVHTHSHTTTSSTRESRPRGKSPEREHPRKRSPEDGSETGDVPHYRLPLDRSVHDHTHTTTSLTRESRPRGKSSERQHPRERSPEGRSETGDVPHYRLPLDRSVHTHSHTTTSSTRESRSRGKSPEREHPRERSPEGGDVPHYRLPLDRSVHDHTGRPRTKSPERDHPRGRSPTGGSETGDVPHYRLPLDRSVHTHTHTTTSSTRESRSRGKSPEREHPRERSPEGGDVPHYRLPLDRSVHDHTGRPITKSPEREHPRARSPTGGSEIGDVPHYRLPLDRSVHSHSHTTTSSTRESRSRGKSPEREHPRERSPEAGDVPHYRLPLDRSVHDHTGRPRTKSPGREHPRARSPTGGSETGDVPHYRLPLDRSVHSHSHTTTSSTRESRPRGKSPEREHPRERSPEAGDVPHYRLPLDRSVHDHTGRPRTKSPEREHPRARSPTGGSETGEVPHYRLPLDRSVHDHTSTVKDSRPRTKSPEREHPRARSPTGGSETGDVPHYRLPLDRSVHTHTYTTTSSTRESRSRGKSPEREHPRARSPAGGSETGEVPHYRLPLDRSVHDHTSTVKEDRPRTKSPEREHPRARSPTGGSETGDVPHYRLPLDRSVHTHTHTTTSSTRESRPRGKSPEGEHPRARSPTGGSETSDVPHYMLPLDRSLHPTNDVPHQPRSKSPGQDSPSTRTPENRDVPHYMLPLEKHPRSQIPLVEKVTPSAKTETRQTKFGVTLRKVQPGSIVGTPTKPSPQKPAPEKHLTQTTTITEEEIQDIFELEILEELLEKIQSYELRKVIRTQIRLVKKLISENTLTIYIKERRESKSTKKTRKHSDHKIETKRTKEETSPYRTDRNRSPEGISTTKTSRYSPTRQQSPTGTQIVTSSTKTSRYSPTRQQSPIGTQTSTQSSYSSQTKTTYSIAGTPEVPTSDDIEIIGRSDRKTNRHSPTRLQSPTGTQIVTSSTKTNRHSPTRQQSPTGTKTSTQSSYSSQTKTTYSITGSPEVPTSDDIEIIGRQNKKTNRHSPTRQQSPTGTQIVTSTTKTSRYSPTRQQSPTGTQTSTQSSYSSQTKTTYSITGTPEVTASEENKTARRSSPERHQKTETYTRTEQTRKVSTDKNITDRSSPKTGTSILKKTETRQKKPEDDKPEWTKQRNLRKVSATSTNEKNTTTTTTTTIKKTAKEEKKTRNVACEPTDLITSSYGVGPTDENGTPLFGLKALRTQHNGTTTKVQGTCVTSEYYSENGKEPVGQISVTKYSTDPRDLGTDQNDELVTSVTTTQRFGYEDAPTLEALTSKKGKLTEDAVTDTNKTSTFKRRNSVKALSQKFIDTTVESLKNERQTSYPKAGLILRSSSFKESKNSASDEDTPTDVITATKTSKQTTMRTTTTGGTFLSNRSTVSGVQDVITRMKTEEYQEGDSSADIEAKSLLNKFIGSQVILSGMENRSTSVKTSKTSSTDLVPTSSCRKTIKITTTATEDGKTKTKTLVFQSPITEEELENIWDEQTLRLVLEQSTQYEERRLIRNRLKRIMAEQEACADLVEKASQEQPDGKIEENVIVEKTTTKTPATSTTTVTKVTTQQQITKKPLSPFAKFRQLDKQNSLNTPPGTPGTPKSPGSGPLFKFTDPAVSLSAATIKDRLLFWCRMKTKEYENVQLDNFSTSWADGLAFCALIHHFLPDAFDYHALTPKERRHNFELAFRVASEKADIFPLLDVDDMMATQRPDWKCVFTYVQSVYRRFKDEEI